MRHSLARTHSRRTDAASSHVQSRLWLCARLGPVVDLALLVPPVALGQLDLAHLDLPPPASGTVPPAAARRTEAHRSHLRPASRQVARRRGVARRVGLPLLRGGSVHAEARERHQRVREAVRPELSLPLSPLTVRELTLAHCPNRAGSASSATGSAHASSSSSPCATTSTRSRPCALHRHQAARSASSPSSPTSTRPCTGTCSAAPPTRSSAAPTTATST